MLLNTRALQISAGQKRTLGAIILTIVLALLLMWTLMPKNKEIFSVAQNELISLADNLRHHYTIRPDYWGLDNESAVKNNLIPEKMRHAKKAISSLGREIIIGQDSAGNMVMPGGRNFMLTIGNLSKSACSAMLAWPLSPKEQPGLIRVDLTTADETTAFEWGTSHSLPITASTAEKYCKNRNTISWIFE